MAHITGGGITENLDRALPKTVNAQVNLGSWPVVPIAKYTCAQAGLNETEALKTFNMGVGMVLIVESDKASDVEAVLAAQGEKTYRIGQIIPGEGVVTYTGEGQLL